MKRTEIEEWMQPWTDSFEHVCKEALSKSGLDLAKIHSVEMVGEGTRMPLVQEITKKVFGVENVSRTQNSLECIAKGAAL